MQGPAPEELETRWILGVGALALGLYATTAAPGLVIEGDSGEFTAAARVAGIPHAPGYPTYMLLASLVGLVSGPEHLARALNLTSAACGALTAALAALLVFRLSARALPGSAPAARRVGAVFGGLLLASSTEFWNQSLGAEVYTLSTALLALCMELALFGPARPRRLLAAALVAGLSFGVHYNVGAASLILVLAGALGRGRPLGIQRVAALVALFALGTSTFLYLPLRSAAEPALDFGDPETLERFTGMLLLRDMPTGKEIARPLGILWQQIAGVARLFASQWPVWALGAGFLGCVLFAARPLRAIGASFLALVVVASGGILAMANFPIREEALYELRFLFFPAYLVFALAIGVGIAWSARSVARFAHGTGAAALLVGAGTLVWIAAQHRTLDKSADHVARDYGLNLLREVEGPAVLFTFGDNATLPLTYLQLVEGLRPEVSVVSVRLLEFPWYREQLARTAPGLVLPSGPLDAGAVARANGERAALFHTDPRPRRLRGFAEVPCGLLTRYVVEGSALPPPAIFPAPALSTRRAPLDKREESLLKSYPQSYSRVADWCLERGYPALAEAAYREGLRVPTPEPASAGFDELRAALQLGLGDLLASQGKLEQARAAWSGARDTAPETSTARSARRRLGQAGAAPEGGT